MFKIIGTASCPYCLRAEDLLNSLDFEIEKVVLTTPEEKTAFKALGFDTVPQIYRDDFLIGGYDDLKQVIKDKLAW